MARLAALELITPDTDDPAQVMGDFWRIMGPRVLARYGDIRHTSGSKRGTSVAQHIRDIVIVAAALATLFHLTDAEARALCLALLAHDINKIPEYGVRPDGRAVRYVDAAAAPNIAAELEALGAADFLPDWRAWLADITWLAQSHQVAATGTSLTFDQRALDGTRLGQRLRSVLMPIVRAADVADLAHSGDPLAPAAERLRAKILDHINLASVGAGGPAYRWILTRLGDLRGLFTNVVHNAVMDVISARGGVPVAVYPEGTDFLWDAARPFPWGEADRRAVVAALRARLAAAKLDDVARFVKGKPFGIGVEEAALQSGASLEAIFTCVRLAAERKRYQPPKIADLRAKVATDLAADAGPEDVVADEAALRRGDLAQAYALFLNTHLAEQTRGEGWRRVYSLFHVPAEVVARLDRVNSYRRFAALAAWLPDLSLDALQDLIVTDLERITGTARDTPPEATERADAVDPLLAYLNDQLQILDSAGAPPDAAPDFAATLRRYAATARRGRPPLCGACGSPLAAAEWMAGEAPAHLAVQAFSNRLEGGAREPKRNICPVCRERHILEKLAWSGHDDRQEGKLATWYAHCFPYTFLTSFELSVWRASLDRLRDDEAHAILLDTRSYFESSFGNPVGQPRSGADALGAAAVRGELGWRNGLSLPALADSFSNTPILPIIAPGANAGERFLLALEHAVIIARFFGCRVLLTQSAIPPLNLARERAATGAPVELLIEGAPRTLAWLVPTAELDGDALRVLLTKLRLLHQIVAEVAAVKEPLVLVRRLAAAAGDDPMALFVLTDRAIERRIAQRRRGGAAADYLALTLSARIAPLLQELAGLPA